MNLSRRGFIAGLLATTSVAAVGININPPSRPIEWATYTSRFNWTEGLAVQDWRYVISMCNIENIT